MFRGASTINLDAKGRMAIPTRHRDQLLERCDGHTVVTIDTDDRCLLLYPLPEWNLIEDQLNAMSNMDPATRRVQRLLVGHAADVQMDANGRLLLPQNLREFASLGKQAALVGQGKKFEIWDAETWSARRDEWMQMRILGGDGVPAPLASLSL